MDYQGRKTHAREAKDHGIPCVVYAAKSTEDRRGSVPEQLRDGKKRRLKASKPRHSYLDRADHIEALLNGASADEPPWRDGRRRALLATLTFAGLRMGEALALEWRDVDLARSTITVRSSKTDAGIRKVNMLPVLHDELDAYKMRLPNPDRTAPVFRTGSGRKYDRAKVGSGILAPAIKNANEGLAKEGQEPLTAARTRIARRGTGSDYRVRLL